MNRHTRTALCLCLATVMPAAAIHAEDGASFGIGADYSSGDYGSETTTDIWSVPLSAQLDAGNWTFKASLPWLRVTGDPNVLPGLGSVDNRNPLGRGRTGLPIGLPGTGPGDEAPERGSASGVGDLSLGATYAVDTGNALGVDLTANAKIATADEDQGLGTGANDYGVAVDLYRTMEALTWFGGAGYTWLGDSDFIHVDAVANANLGVSHTAGAGNLGLSYDWREAAIEGFDDRSEVTGFYGVPAGQSGQFQVYLLHGLSDGGPELGGGVRYTLGL